MARSFARITTAVWTDRTFLGLTGAAQRAFFLAISQSSIQLTGLVAYQPKKWATFAADSSPSKVRKAVQELEAARFVVVDGDVEELLVRSFIKHEKPLQSPKLGPALARQLDDIHSPRLLNVVVDEIERAVDGDPEVPKGLKQFNDALSRRFPMDYRMDYRIVDPKNDDGLSDSSMRARAQDPEPEPEMEPIIPPAAWTIGSSA